MWPAIATILVALVLMPAVVHWISRLFGDYLWFDEGFRRWQDEGRLIVAWYRFFLINLLFAWFAAPLLLTVAGFIAWSAWHVSSVRQRAIMGTMLCVSGLWLFDVITLIRG